MSGNEQMFGGSLLEPETSHTSRRARTRREIALRDIGGIRIVNSGYSIPVKVPADAEYFLVTSIGGISYLEIGDSCPEASSLSTFVVPQNLVVKDYPVAPGHAITCYGGSAAVITTFRFFGRAYSIE